MKVYLNDEKKSVDPRLRLKRVDSTDRNHCAIFRMVKGYFKAPTESFIIFFTYDDAPFIRRK